MQQTLIISFKVLPLWVLYALMSLVIPFYMAFAPGFRASYRFFRDRIGMNPLKALLYVYKNEFTLGQIVLDRFAAYGGQGFKVEVRNRDIFEDLCDQDSGFIMMTAHVGNFEMAGYSLDSRKPINALVFAGETETIRDNRSLAFARKNVRMIPVREDMSHIYMINEALSKGEIISIDADRTNGSDKEIECGFFGSKAGFPLGPFKLAAAKDVPVIVAYTIKTGLRRYEVFIEALPEYGEQADKVRFLADRYAASLEKIVRRFPAQWFNFYDFWA